MPFHTKNYQMFAEHADSEILMPQMNTQIFGITAQRVYISQQRKTHVKSKISNYARSNPMTELPTYLLSNPIAFHAIGAMLAIVTGWCCIAVASVIRLVVRK